MNDVLGKIVYSGATKVLETCGDVANAISNVDVIVTGSAEPLVNTLTSTEMLITATKENVGGVGNLVIVCMEIYPK